MAVSRTTSLKAVTASSSTLCSAVPQRLAAGPHRGLRRIDRVDRAEAAKQRLHQAHLVAARVAVAVDDAVPGWW